MPSMWQHRLVPCAHLGSSPKESYVLDIGEGWLLLWHHKSHDIMLKSFNACEYPIQSANTTEPLTCISCRTAFVLPGFRV